MNRRRALLSLLMASGVLGNCLPARSQELFGPPEPFAPSVRVLFFNTHLLPAIAQAVAGHRGQDDYRTAAIAAQLHRYDLIGLCEVFEARRRREIVETLQRNSGGAYRHVASPPATGRHLIGGGLLLLSRLPIEGEPNFLTYRKASRVVTNGWKADGFAAKGAIHARLRVASDPVVLADCFLTHLESVSKEARTAQIEELGRFVALHSSPRRPLILFGDLNVEADYPLSSAAARSEYRVLTDTLRHGGVQLVDAWPAMHSGRGGTSDALARQECRRIDYIFLSPPGAQGHAAWRLHGARVEPFLDREVKQGSLSDHAGLECELSLQDGE